MVVLPYKFSNIKSARKYLASIGVSLPGINIMAPKSIFCTLKIKGLKSYQANIIKQQLLSLGSDAALNKEVIVKDLLSDIFIFGTLQQLKLLCKKLHKQAGTLRDLSQNIDEAIDNYFRDSYILEIKGKVYRLVKPLICGIINLTYDSFSGDGLLGKFKKEKELIKSVLEKISTWRKEGMSIIDIGAESSRPFSKPIDEEEEIRRLKPVLQLVRKEFKDLLISVDTYKFKVAKMASDQGVDIINDITGLRHSPSIAKIIKENRLGVVIMHMRGNPQTMQINPYYKEGVIENILVFLKERIDFCRSAGIRENQILVDPGIGFGKSWQDNLNILAGLDKFKVLGRPIFLGVSRKSFIGKVLGNPVEERLIGSVSAQIIGILNGAKVLRVHDVKETRESIDMVWKIVRNMNMN